MNRKLEKIRQRNLKDAEIRQDKRRRALIAAIRGLPNPLRYDAIREHQLRESSAEWFGGALHFVEAEALLQGAMSECIGLGWLQEIHRKRPDSFDLKDEFKVMLTAYTVKKKNVKKRVLTPGTARIVVREVQYGLKIKCANKTADLTGYQEILFETLYVANQNGKVVSVADFKNSSVESLRNAISDLRTYFHEQLELDREFLKEGIKSVRGQGYSLNTNVLEVQWRKGTHRQRNTISCNSM